MKRKGMLKCLTVLTMMVLVFCLLPVRAEAGSVTANNGFRVEVRYFDPQNCSDCTRDDALGRHGVSEVTASCSVSNGTVTVSGTFTYGCDNAAGPVGYQCSFDGFSCSADFSKDEYINPAGGTGWVQVTRSAGHSAGGWTSNGNGTHTGTCALCGEKITGNCSGDSKANCTVEGTCTDCQGKYTLPDNHAYSWSSDGNKHWQECANNSAHKIEEGKCAVGSNGTAATCTSKAVCGTCGKSFGDKDAAAHVWDDWTHGEVDANHTRTCKLDSNHTETKSHDFDYAVASDDAGHLYGTCETCGYLMQAQLAMDTGKSTVYSGSAITPLKITYSGNWVGEKAADTAITYSGNVDAGEATGTVTIAGKQLVCKFTVDRAPLTITDITARSRAYDGTEDVAITALTFTGKINGDDVDIKLPVGTVAGADADTYNAVTLPANDQLELTGADKTNYAVTSGSTFSETVTISPREIKITITAPNSVYGKVTAPAIKFNGLLEQDASCAVASYEGTTEKVVDGEKVTYQGTAVPTEAGTYTVKVAVNSDNYTLTGKTSASFKIAKAPTAYTAPKAKKLSYNGTEQALLEAGTVSGNSNSFRYKKEKDKQWGTTIPTAKNAGTDVILWSVAEDENHLSASGKVEVAIDPATLTIIPDAGQKTTYGKVRETLTYKVKGAIDKEVPVFTGELTVYGKDAGTYEIKLGSLKMVDKGTFKAANYEIKLEKVNYVINPAYVVLTAEDQIITCGTSIDSKKYTITDLPGDDAAAVTLTPSTTGVTYGGTITPSVVIKNEDGEDVSKNYYVAAIAGKLIVEPDFAVVEDVTIETVNHSEKDAIQALQTSLNSADTAKATAAQKKRIEEVKETCAALLERIEKSAQAMETDAIKSTADTTAETVKIGDKAAIEQAIKDIEQAKEAYAGNYSDEDLKKLDGQTAQLQGALETIAHAQTVIDLLSALPETVKAEDARSADARAAIKALTEHEKELVKASGSGKLMDAVSYKIISGNHDTWKRGENLTFKIDGDYNRFTGIEVDGKTVDEKFYTAEEGSTVVTLKKAYLKKLGAETDHTIKFRFDDGEVDGIFYVSKDAAHGGFSFLGTLIWLIVLATVAGAAFLYIRKKKNG